MKLQAPKLKSFKEKSAQFRTHQHGTRYLDHGFNVFVNSNLSDLIDDFFSKNKIYSLDFKCKTWTKLKNFVAKVECAEIKKAMGLNEDAMVAYSSKAGCSCGCSPGFRVRKVSRDFQKMFNTDRFADLKFDTKVIEAALPEFQKMLNAEIKSH